MPLEKVEEWCAEHNEVELIAQFLDAPNRCQTLGRSWVPISQKLA
jgi:hypothetical protein